MRLKSLSGGLSSNKQNLQVQGVVFKAFVSQECKIKPLLYQSMVIFVCLERGGEGEGSQGEGDKESFFFSLKILFERESTCTSRGRDRGTEKQTPC